MTLRLLEWITEHEYEKRIAQLQAALVKVENDVLYWQGRAAELEAAVEDYEHVWLLMMRRVAELYDAVEGVDESEAWTHADDGTLLEQFDPWKALAVATATVKEEASDD